MVGRSRTKATDTKLHHDICVPVIRALSGSRIGLASRSFHLLSPQFHNVRSEDIISGFRRIANASLTSSPYSPIAHPSGKLLVASGGEGPDVVTR
jgi:hypothetical protein